MLSHRVVALVLATVAAGCKSGLKVASTNARFIAVSSSRSAKTSSLVMTASYLMAAKYSVLYALSYPGMYRPGPNTVRINEDIAAAMTNG